MREQTLHQFHLSLIPNLLKELYFFIPENEIRPDIIETLDILKEYNFLDTVLVFDEYEGPIPYVAGRSNKQILLKEGNLEKNIFKLLEKKSEGKAHEYSYVLNKYFELVETMFYIIKWMHYNPIKIIQTNSYLSGIFCIQYESYKKHFEVLVKTFYDSKEAIPKGNFNAHDIIDTYFPDVINNFKKKAPSLNLENWTNKFKTTTPKKTTTPLLQSNKKDKKALISEAEAEKILLQTFFNIGKK